MYNAFTFKAGIILLYFSTYVFQESKDHLSSAKLLIQYNVTNFFKTSLDYAAFPQLPCIQRIQKDLRAAFKINLLFQRSRLHKTENLEISSPCVLPSALRLPLDICSQNSRTISVAVVCTEVHRKPHSLMHIVILEVGNFRMCIHWGGLLIIWRDALKNNIKRVLCLSFSFSLTFGSMCNVALYYIAYVISILQQIRKQRTN